MFIVHSGICTLGGPEHDSKRVETCRPRIIFYVMNMCIDKHIGMTNIKETSMPYSIRQSYLCVIVISTVKTISDIFLLDYK